jgi:diguanylate cyclase
MSDTHAGSTIQDSANKVTRMSEYAEKILVVDDESLHLKSLKTLLDQHGYRVDLANSGEAAIEMLKTMDIDLLLLDLNMHGIGGVEVMEYIRDNHINTTVIVVSGGSSFEAVQNAIKHGAYDYIRKPYAFENLVNSVNNALKKRQLEAENIVMQIKLQESEKLHRYMVNKSPDIVYMLDTLGRFTFINTRIETLLGYKRNEIIGQHYTDIIHEEDHEKSVYVFNERRSHSRGTNASVELRLKCKNSETSRCSNTRLLPVEINSVGVYNMNSDGQSQKFVGTYGIARDITDRIEAEEIIRFQAYHDMLTRLPNRTLLQDRLYQAISHAKRNNTRLAVMFLDLDRFKVVNDTLGHIIGDKLLQAVSVRLKKCIRECDTLGRIGGDEFTLLLPDVKSYEDSEHVAQKIIAGLKDPFSINGHEFFISASIGIAHFPEDGQSMDTLIKHADIAMYHVKGHGKDGYQLFNSGMNEIYSRHMAMENDMRRALQGNQFQIYYQPQVNIETGEVFAMEALIRWNHPVKGMISPIEFMSIAEETGLILPIGDWVLQKACEDLNRWRQSGLTDVRVALNLSVCQLSQDNIVADIINTLKAYDIPGDKFEIEITENVLMKDMENCILKLSKLNDYGIKIAIDDFGTGYSSLSYLKKLPIDTIKIDRSFIHDMHNCEENASIVIAIIAMARGLNLNIISEGVETMEQLEQLRTWRCMNAQGFLFGRPMAETDAIEVLRKTQTLQAKTA